MLFSENIWSLITISLKLVPKCPINNIPTLIHILTRCRPSDKPLSEPMILERELELEKYLLDKKLIQARKKNDTYRMFFLTINDTCRMFYVGRPLQRRWAHRWHKSHPKKLQYMDRHRAHEVLTFWEHTFGICSQKENSPLGKAPSRHTRGTQLAQL